MKAIAAGEDENDSNLAEKIKEKMILNINFNKDSTFYQLILTLIIFNLIH